jgi:hypothetical protein
MDGRGTLTRLAYDSGMCRNIHTLYNMDPPTRPDEIEEAALQYVRKVSGMRKPSRANQAAFDEAVDSVTEATRRLLQGLVTQAPVHDRALEAERRRARAAERYGRVAS